MRNTTEADWDDIADLWARDLRAGRDPINDKFGIPFFLTQLQKRRDGLLLDAGCGEGRSTRAIARYVAPERSRIIGVDISSAMIRLAEEEERREPLGITYVEAPCADLEFLPSDSVCTITSYMALMDTANLDMVIKEFSRVLGSGGLLFAMVRHPCFFTPGFSILKEGRERVGLSVANYFACNTYDERLKLADKDAASFAVKRYPYTLSYYMSNLIQCGFEILDVCEPAPSKAITQILPGLSFWAKHAGIYLFIRARKR